MIRKSRLDVPFAPIEKIMKNSTNLRISSPAVERLTEEIISKGKKIGARALMIAQNSGRKTVNDKDIKLAFEHI